MVGEMRAVTPQLPDRARAACLIQAQHRRKASRCSAADSGPVMTVHNPLESLAEKVGGLLESAVTTVTAARPPPTSPSPAPSCSSTPQLRSVQLQTPSPALAPTPQPLAASLAFCPCLTRIRGGDDPPEAPWNSAFATPILSRLLWHHRNWATGEASALSCLMRHPLGPSQAQLPSLPAPCPAQLHPRLAARLAGHSRQRAPAGYHRDTLSPGLFARSPLDSGRSAASSKSTRSAAQLAAQQLQAG